jgi:hypothetical protein
MNNKTNTRDVRVVTRGEKMTKDPLYPEGHPKRIEQDSQKTNNDVPSSPRNKKKKKKKDRNLHASSELEIDKPSGNPNNVSISDAETQSGSEHPFSDNDNDVHVDAQPNNDK